ncbi:MAG: CPBP family intramembrane metalloprotease [Deltaproteobacteria bacterium]|nr:MAG: CPBP family intramembrane metalloprotease [Deltaproteobacteria bacterium]
MTPARRRAVVAVSVAVEGGLGVLAVAVGVATGYPPWSTLTWNLSGALTGAAAAVPMLVFFALLWRTRRSPVASIRNELERRILPLFRECSLVELAAVCIAAGAGEELLFRGLVQGGLTSTLGDGGALVVASVLFALAHPITTLYSIVAGLLGTYLGWLWLWCGNLLAPIVAHSLYDFVGLAFVVRRSGPA